ncbi:5'-AMP-activated protein kinase beta subunit, interation domain-containing protein [Multifurca ochricompacta]|uniref:5'-AMP-activated protein kinase beta subunit, interation domain-containing protein n=1 Tax=Multifurca ochricompacta TaxID=376703 RepID=A0AAD4M6F4_9AGAM|nr:5'-AMP-activated protein kinase beta subunit, interation domain-containing protein [Multifurca ochricompacta]
MGNSASSGTHNPSATTQTTNNPQDRDNREKPPPHSVHRSLRTKKKSLELPDLASLSLTPAPSHLNSPNHSPRPHYRRPKASSPIPIPAQPLTANGADYHYQSYPRPNQLSSTTQMPDVLVQQQPPAHIPVFPPAQRHRSTPNASNRSFMRPSQATHLQPIKDIEPAHEHETKVISFFPETIHSTIPLAMTQAEASQPPTRTRLSPIDEPPHPVDMKISWHGGGKTVLLARAGDNNWKGRQVMERSASDPDIFTTTVSLLPGTHHIKFIVDDNWRLAQDLPTAVDDDGSLANYVSVPLPAGPSTPASPPPASSSRQAHQISFWSQASDSGVYTPFGDEGWTSVIPFELTAAAREEEVFLANGAVGTAPNIPPAPVLPRHLDKLILNTRVGAPPPAPVKDRRHRARSRHGEFGMTKSEQDESPVPGPSRIPVTTASGTDVSAARHGHPSSHSHSPVRALVGGSTAALNTTAAALMLADDASVLPVPSHVVLHHLSTSAIRNGVLAVGNTTRYKKKFISTIYYKPT